MCVCVLDILNNFQALWRLSLCVHVAFLQLLAFCLQLFCVFASPSAWMLGRSACGLWLSQRYVSMPPFAEFFLSLLYGHYWHLLIHFEAALCVINRSALWSRSFVFFSHIRFALSGSLSLSLSLSLSFHIIHTKLTPCSTFASHCCTVSSWVSF